MKILIVDDVKGWIDYHSHILKNIFKDAEIITASCAREGYDLLVEHNWQPFDIIITDLQMESDFAPKHAGEWFVEQIKTFKSYAKTRIIMISASYNIKQIADSLGVECIAKSTARNFPDAYDFLNN